MRATANAIAVAVVLTAGAVRAAPPRSKGHARPVVAPRSEAGATFEEARLGGAARDVLVSGEVEALIRAKEQLVVEKRRAAIALLMRFLAEHPGVPEEAELLFQLAELRWEEAKAEFL